MEGGKFYVMLKQARPYSRWAIDKRIGEKLMVGEKYRFDPDLYRPYTHQLTNYNMSVDIKDAVMHEFSRKEDVQGVYSPQPDGRRQHGALNRHGSEGYNCGNEH